MNKKKSGQAEALKKAISYCSRKERCTSDIYDALTRWGCAHAHHEIIVKRLIKLNFVNDERYARIYVQSHLRYNGWGRNRMRQGLRIKGITGSVIEKSLNSISDEQYLRVIKKVAMDKWCRCKGSLYKKRKKTHCFLLQKGFEPALSRQIIFGLK